MTNARKRKSKWRIPAITPIGSDQPVSKTLPLAIERIVRELKPEKIILFGSYAYGTPTPDSDVDLLVVMNTQERSPIKRALPVMRLIVPRPFDTDILVRTPDEVERSRRDGSPFIKEILTKGRILYERRE